MSSITASPSSVTFVNHGQKNFCNKFIPSNGKQLEHTDASCGQSEWVAFRMRIRHEACDFQPKSMQLIELKKRYYIKL